MNVIYFTTCRSIIEGNVYYIYFTNPSNIAMTKDHYENIKFDKFKFIYYSNDFTRSAQIIKGSHTEVLVNFNWIINNVIRLNEKTQTYDVVNKLCHEITKVKTRLKKIEEIRNDL